MGLPFFVFDVMGTVDANGSLRPSCSRDGRVARTSGDAGGLRGRLEMREGCEDVWRCGRVASDVNPPLPVLCDTRFAWTW